MQKKALKPAKKVNLWVTINFAAMSSPVNALACVHLTSF